MVHCACVWHGVVLQNGLEYYSRLTLFADDDAGAGGDAAFEVTGAADAPSLLSSPSTALFPDDDDDVSAKGAGTGALALSGKGSAPTGSGT